MTDIMHKLAAVSHLQAQDASTSLDKLADDQKQKIYEKRAARDVQEYYDKVMSDEIVSFDELQTLHEMRSEIGSTDEAFWENGRVAEFSDYGGNGRESQWDYDASKVNESGNGNNDGYYLETGDAENATNRENKATMEGIEREIDGVMEGLEDDEALLQFNIQIGTSKMTSAEQSRAGAEKRLEDHRKNLQQKWEA